MTTTLTSSIINSVVDSLRESKLSSNEALFITGEIFLWLKLSAENKLEEHETFNEQDKVFERFKNFNFVVSQGYGASITSKLIIDDHVLVQITKKVTNAIKSGVTNYSAIAEQLFNISLVSSSSEIILAPNELVDLGCRLFSHDIESVYCPFSSSYRFAEYLASTGKKVSFEGQDNIAWIRMSAELKDIEYLDWFKSNPITEPSFLGKNGLATFSHVIGMPPFGSKYPNNITDIFGRFPEKTLGGEVLQTRHMLAQAEKEVVTFVNDGFLSRTTAGEKQFKHTMIQQGWLKAIIALPEKLLSLTNIGINVLIFDKTTQHADVQFIDARNSVFVSESGKKSKLTNIDEILALYQQRIDSEYSIVVSASELENNEYNLLPSRYVLSKEHKELIDFLNHRDTSKLGDIAKIISPQAIKDELNGTYHFREFSLSHINTIGQLVGDGKLITTDTQKSRAQKQLLKSGDVLIVNKGSTGRVALVESDGLNDTIASQAFSIIRLQSHMTSVTPISLYQYLVSPFGQQQLNSFATGTTVSMISTKDLKSIIIPHASNEEIASANDIRLKTIQLHQQQQQLEKNIDELNHTNWLL